MKALAPVKAIPTLACDPTSVPTDPAHTPIDPAHGPPDSAHATTDPLLILHAGLLILHTLLLILHTGIMIFLFTIQQQLHTPASAHVPPTHDHTGKVKLPKISLPHFHGSLTKWTPFWDSFYPAVHTNDQLTDVNKFNYRRALFFRGL